MGLLSTTTLTNIIVQLHICVLKAVKEIFIIEMKRGRLDHDEYITVDVTKRIIIPDGQQ